jgi:hypothetical protein
MSISEINIYKTARQEALKIEESILKTLSAPTDATIEKIARIEKLRRLAAFEKEPPALANPDAGTNNRLFRPFAHVWKTFDDKNPASALTAFEKTMKTWDADIAKALQPKIEELSKENNLSQIKDFLHKFGCEEPPSHELPLKVAEAGLYQNKTIVILENTSTQDRQAFLKTEDGFRPFDGIGKELNFHRNEIVAEYIDFGAHAEDSLLWEETSQFLNKMESVLPLKEYKDAKAVNLAITQTMPEKPLKALTIEYANNPQKIKPAALHLAIDTHIQETLQTENLDLEKLKSLLPPPCRPARKLDAETIQSYCIIYSIEPHKEKTQGTLLEKIAATVQTQIQRLLSPQKSKQKDMGMELQPC